MLGTSTFGKGRNSYKVSGSARSSILHSPTILGVKIMIDDEIGITNLWLGILARAPALKKLSDDETRTYLKESNFPDKIIELFISTRHE